MVSSTFRYRWKVVLLHALTIHTDACILLFHKNFQKLILGKLIRTTDILHVWHLANFVRFVHFKKLRAEFSCSGHVKQLSTCWSGARSYQILHCCFVSARNEACGKILLELMNALVKNFGMIAGRSFCYFPIKFLFGVETDPLFWKHVEGICT